jgi:hypothetical protein
LSRGGGQVGAQQHCAWPKHGTSVPATGLVIVVEAIKLSSIRRTLTRDAESSAFAASRRALVSLRASASAGPKRISRDGVFPKLGHESRGA